MLSGIFFMMCTFVPMIIAQVPFPKQCPNVTIPDVFDVDAYLGVWYEYSKYPFAFEIGKKCIYATYGLESNDTVSVVNSAISRFTNKPSNISGKGYIIAPGQLAVTFSRNQRASKPNYIVLGTDYDSFSVVYSCSNFTPFAHIKIVWILTRERQPNAETIAAAKKVLTFNNISQTFLIDTLQEGCPDINDGNNVATSTEVDADPDVYFTSTLPNEVRKL